MLSSFKSLLTKINSEQIQLENLGTYETTNSLPNESFVFIGKMLEPKICY